MNISQTARQPLVLFALVYGAVWLSGCATTSVPPPSFLAHTNLSERIKGIRTVMLLPPIIQVYQVTVGGSEQPMSDWAEASAESVGVAFESRLYQTGFSVRKLDANLLDTKLKENLEQTQSRYDSIHANILGQVLSDNQELAHMLVGPGLAELFASPSNSSRVVPLEHTLGPDVARLAEGADAFLIVRGSVRIPSKGRATAEVSKMIAVGVLAGLGGGYGYYREDSGSTEVSAALVDAKTGDLLWVDSRGTNRGYDLRNPETAAFVRAVLEHFPLQ